MSIQTDNVYINKLFSNILFLDINVKLAQGDDK